MYSVSRHAWPSLAAHVLASPRGGERCHAVTERGRGPASTLPDIRRCCCPSQALRASSPLASRGGGESRLRRFAPAPYPPCRKCLSRACLRNGPPKARLRCCLAHFIRHRRRGPGSPSRFARGRTSFYSFSFTFSTTFQPFTSCMAAKWLVTTYSATRPSVKSTFAQESV